MKVGDKNTPDLKSWITENLGQKAIIGLNANLFKSKILVSYVLKAILRL